MSVQVFVDESKARGFLLAAAQIPCGAVSRVRDEVTALHLPRQVRLHFTNESPQRRRQIISAFASAGDISATVYDASGYGDDGKGRPRRRDRPDGRERGADACLADHPRAG